MKAIILLIVICWITNTTLFAQEISQNQVPESVVKAFQIKYPTAKKTEWEKEDNDYEVEFYVGKEELTTKFDKSGNWIETEKEIKIAQLPQSITQTIKKEFSNFKVKEAAQIENVSKGKLFEISLKNSKETWELLCMEDGTIVDKKMENKEDDKED